MEKIKSDYNNLVVIGNGQYLDVIIEEHLKQSFTEKVKEKIEDKNWINEILKEYFVENKNNDDKITISLNEFYKNNLIKEELDNYFYKNNANDVFEVLIWYIFNYTTIKLISNLSNIDYENAEKIFDFIYLKIKYY